MLSAVLLTEYLESAIRVCGQHRLIEGQIKIMCKVVVFPGNKNEEIPT